MSLLVTRSSRTTIYAGSICRVRFFGSALPDQQPVPVSKVRYYYTKMRDGTVHSWHWFKNGSLLFRKNFSISQVLLKKKVHGDELTFRERQLLVKTTADVLKLIPFSFFLIVPFAELLLPVVLKVWPQMLPSTFDAKKLFPPSTTDRSRRLLAKQEMLKFFSEISIKQDMDALSRKATEEKMAKLAEFKQLLNKPRLAGQPLPSVEELLNFASLFQTEFKLDNMPMNHLESICYLIGIDPYPFRSHVILQLKRYIGGIKREDRHISWEGIDSLTREDLIEANRRRGMPHQDSRESHLLKSQLRSWIQISSSRTIPISLLLWTRAFFVTENPDLLQIDAAPVNAEAAARIAAAAPAAVEAAGTTSRIKHMSEDVWMRLAELEKLEHEVTEASEVDKSRENQTVKELEQQVLLIEQKSELIKSQLSYLRKIKKLKRSSKIDDELKNIQKGFLAENKRIDDLIRKALND